MRSDNNILSITGSHEDLIEFARYVRSDEMVFSFEEILPEPAWRWRKAGCFNICDQEWDFGNEVILNRLHWRIGYWGTEHDLGKDTGFYLHENTLRYEFETTWYPPDEIIKELVRVFPNLEIKCKSENIRSAFYGECGGKSGKFFLWDGKMTPDTHPDYYTHPCVECHEIYLHDGRDCPHCSSNKNAEKVETTL